MEIGAGFSWRHGSHWLKAVSSQVAYELLGLDCSDLNSKASLHYSSPVYA